MNELTPDNCGASQLACNIINSTFLSLDGFEAMRKQMAGTDYTAEQFGSELARIADREVRMSHPTGRLSSRLITQRAIRLRIFAYHITCITKMNPGDTATFYPLGDESRIEVKLDREGHYRVDGVGAGNVWGATAAFTRQVMGMVDSIHPDNDKESQS